MHHLPLECIAMVIEFFDSRQDLFNLLTVSKDIFLLTARCLYRDPTKTSVNVYDGSIRKLILFLLSLSPASGKNINMIRQSNDLSPSGTSLDPKPMIDYLSLVKVVHWRFRLTDDDPLYSELEYSNNDLYRELTWAFVGHRLDGVEELEIDVEDQERYLSNTAKMTNLRKIWIHRDIGTSHKGMYDFAEAMIKAIQLHHGPDQVHECRMLPNAIEWCPYAYDNNDSFHEIDLSGAWRVISLLPPPRHYRTLPSPDGSMVSLNHPFDPYVATINEIWSIDRRDAPSWKVMSKLYPGQSQAQILQRLRGLTSLHIHPVTAYGNDENFLAWAAYEAEQYLHQPVGHQLGPLVPLERLDVRYRELSPFVEPRIRAATPKWKILQDGLLGFSGTLKLLEVNYPRCKHRAADHLIKFTIPRPLLKLKSLILHELTIDRSSWEYVPNIEDIDLRIDFPPLRDGSPISNWSQDDQNAGVTPLSPTLIDTITTTTTDSTEQQPHRELSEIWFHCPKLMKLTLGNHAVNLLDPNCFHFSPNLHELRLIGWDLMDHAHITEDDVDPCQTLEILCPLHPTRWTWDWSFPLLSHLTLDFDLHELRFSLAILHSCPTLKSMTLDHQATNHRLPLRAKGIIDTSLDKNSNNSNMLPFGYSKLVRINFRGDWDVEVDELICLLQVLPNLKEIEFKSVHFDNNFGDRELIEVTKTHPALVFVTTDIVRTTEPPSALGLSGVKDMDTEMESVNRAMESKDDNEMPEGRTRIIFTFKSYDRYALYF